MGDISKLIDEEMPKIIKEIEEKIRAEYEKKQQKHAIQLGIAITATAVICIFGMLAAFAAIY